MRTLSRREQPESVLPFPPGKSCCCFGVLAVAQPAVAWLPKSCPCPWRERSPGWRGYLALRPELCQTVMAWTTELVQFWKSWEMERLENSFIRGFGATSAMAHPQSCGVTAGCWRPV